MIPTDKDNHLYVDLGQLYNSSVIFKSLEAFPSYRSLYNLPTVQDLELFYCNEIAKTLNMSIWPVADISPEVSPTFPIISPMTSNIPMESILKSWNGSNPDQTPKSPALFHVETSYQTFLYHGTNPNRIQAFWTTIFLFVDLFDLESIYIIFILAALVTVLLFLNLRYSGGPSPERSFQLAVLYTFSGLLSPVLNNTTQLPKSHAKITLAYLWTLCCSVVMSYYTGTLTRQLAYQLPGNRFETVKDLLSANVTLIYSSDFWRLLDYDIVRHSVGQKYLIELIEKSFVSKNVTGLLVRGEKVTFFARKHYLTRKMGLLNREHKIDFYLGKEYFLPLRSYFVFYNCMEASRSMDVFKMFFNSGVFDKWLKEYIGTLSFYRVQNRAKSLAIVKHLDILLGETPPVSMNRQMQSVLTLFVYGCLVSVTVMVGEVMWRLKCK